MLDPLLRIRVFEQDSVYCEKAIGWEIFYHGTTATYSLKCLEPRLIIDAGLEMSFLIYTQRIIALEVTQREYHRFAPKRLFSRLLAKTTPSLLFLKGGVGPFSRYSWLSPGCCWPVRDVVSIFVT